jgi:hypothetical protein
MKFPAELVPVLQATLKWEGVLREVPLQQIPALLLEQQKP